MPLCLGSWDCEYQSSTMVEEISYSRKMENSKETLHMWRQAAINITALSNMPM